MFKSENWVYIDVPAQLPQEFDSFDDSWKEWIRKVHGRRVKLNYQDDMIVDSYPSIPGWYIGPPDDARPSAMTLSWIPTDWLVRPLIDSGAYCNLCGGYGRHRLGCPSLKKSYGD